MKSEKRLLTLNDSTGKSINIVTYYVDYCNFNDIVDTIDREFVDIKKRTDGYDLESTKKDLLKTLSNKLDYQKYAMVAEFFSHLFLRSLGYVQQSLFENLEEKSFKKGFDGLYQINEDFWIMESKSAITDKKHIYKIKEAINSVEESIELNKNNPWENAVHHYICCKGNSDEDTIFQKIKKLSIDYQREIKHDMSEFRIIPVSTLFVDNKQSVDEICKDIIKGIKIDFKDIIVICIDNKLYDDFMSYLEE